MKNLGQMLKQAQELQSRMAAMQEKLATVEITGSAGGGMVRVTIDGKGEAKKVTIDPSLMAPGEEAVVEDLVRAALNDAKGKLEAVVREKMSELTGGLPLPPGMQLPF
ncbi:MAG: nucleoid-associated protein, YbaB/EbfC family [Rhodospirillales bacterium RIFCSPLOWO2_01_FULL_65_14]|nr:MAG: nucleoid-associated protein, YbaB/EbfC family [Rhodospirillales bacterium RIFCSPLOWO2_01_FULL_65_14]